MLASGLVDTPLILGFAAALLLCIGGCASVETDFLARVKKELVVQSLQPVRLLTHADLAHLPAPVEHYIVYTGAVGKEIPQNMRIVFDANMTRKPGASPMNARSVQYNFLDNPARLFFMKASEFLVPFRVLHAYADRRATMQVRVAGLFNAVDLSGEELSRAETVTILNDLCAFAPACLIRDNCAWEEVDAHSARVFFTNGPYTVSALLEFNDAGELVNFVSDDRSALQDDGTLKRLRWWTPLRDYRDFNGRKIATRGDAIYGYPEGPFCYGSFTLKDIRFNVTASE